MLRRISVILASVAMLAFSAMPAFAATHSSTHKLHFPSLHGVQAWGTYKKSGRGVKIYVCTKDNNPGYFAVGAVTLESNSSNTFVTNLGAVAIGYGQTVCRSGTVFVTGHLRIYTFIAGSNGRIAHRSKIKSVY
jgi:hypothetical protein